MFRLENISKKYLSDRTGSQQALRNINLTFASSGMVFILGKSGSGKTTLLNIVGFLDVPSFGEIYVDDERLIVDSKTADKFRNQYSSFIFQEFNLIENETVEKNVSLALEMQNVKDTNGKVDGALKEVGLTGYNKRTPHELSGGERQRVAIARALVKNSQMILADEPTGNLDSENSDSIFELLKKLATTKLVVAVTHDRDFAERYADRIIEIKDGQVISDSSNHTYTENNQSFVKRESSFRFPTTLAVKMGLKNLGKKKSRSILTIFIAILSIFSMAFAQTLLSFSAEKALAQTIDKNNIQRIGFYQNSTQDAVMPYDEWTPLKIGSYENEFSDEENIIKKVDNHFIIDSKNQMDAFDFDFHNYEELTDDSVYVSDYLIDKSIYNGMSVSEDGLVFIPYNTSIHSYDWLIGKTAKIINVREYEYKIAGIVKTDYKVFYDENFEPYKNAREPYSNEKLFFERFNYLDTYSFNCVYSTYSFLKRQVKSIHFQTDYSIGVFNGKNNVSFGKMNLANTHAQISGILSSADTLQDISSLNLAENEVIITTDTYNRLFSDKILFDTYVEDDPIEGKFKVKRYPDNLGIKIKVNISEKDTDKNVFEQKELVISGIIMEQLSRMETDNYGMIVHNNALLSCADIGFLNDRVLVNLKDYEKDNFRLLESLRKNHNMVTDFEYSKTIYDNEQAQRNVGYIFLVFGIIMAVMTILIMISLISFSIVRQTKEIGILRSIGARNKDIVKIYLFESLVISIVVFSFSLAFMLLAILFNNAHFSSITLPNIILLSFSPFALLILFVASLILINVATLIPLRRISKLTPIEAIRNIN